MNKLTAGRPSATKSKLSVADVSEQERIKRISFDMTEANHRELKKICGGTGRNHSGSAEWFN